MKAQISKTKTLLFFLIGLFFFSAANLNATSCNGQALSKKRNHKNKTGTKKGAKIGKENKTTRKEIQKTKKKSSFQQKNDATNLGSLDTYLCNITCYNSCDKSCGASYQSFSWGSNWGLSDSRTCDNIF